MIPVIAQRHGRRTDQLRHTAGEDDSCKVFRGMLEDRLCSVRRSAPVAHGARRGGQRHPSLPVDRGSTGTKPAWRISARPPRRARARAAPMSAAPTAPAGLAPKLVRSLRKQCSVGLGSTDWVLVAARFSATARDGIVDTG